MMLKIDNATKCPANNEAQNFLVTLRGPYLKLVNGIAELEGMTQDKAFQMLVEHGLMGFMVMHSKGAGMFAAGATQDEVLAAMLHIAMPEFTDALIAAQDRQLPH